MSDGAPMIEMTLLAQLQDAGAARFDPAGWHYIDSLARRAAMHDGSTRRLLDEKFTVALTAFAERLAQARIAAAEGLVSACEAHPHAAVELQRLFAQNDFRGLRRRHAALNAGAHCAALNALAARLEPGGTHAPGPAPAQHAALPAAQANAPALELKTVRESRDTWARLSVDKQLASAMKQAPLNAGPINSHMLILRSLAKMQAISPDYLNRMVSYVDTLLSLDPGEMAVPAKKKKAVASKSGKPAKAPRK